MSLSPETQQRLDAARRTQDDYRPNEAVHHQLADKILTMVVAPAAMGKTYLMKQAESQQFDFRRTPVFTTRQARADDEPGMFRIWPHDESYVQKLLDTIGAGEAVQYAIHPTKDTIYGTMAADYGPERYNLLATLSGAVTSLEQAGFEQTHVVGVVANPSSWQRWFNQRYPQPSPEKLSRLHEAAMSLDWLTQQPNICWIINQEGRADEASAELVAISQGTSKGDDPELALTYVNRIRQLIPSLIQQETIYS